VLAATVRVTRDLDLAEESVQDAYVQALTTWNRDGVPDRPGAWLTTAARRNALNALRRRRTLQAKLPLLMAARITRAKKKIAVARIPYRVPAAEDLPERVDTVLTVIHLLYAAGRHPPARAWCAMT
jgi:predicted RNA polymerase sigma factor